MSDQSYVAMSPYHRAAFRKAITSHPLWDEWRLRNLANIAAMTHSEMLDCARHLGIDPATYGTVKAKKGWQSSGATSGAAWHSAKDFETKATATETKGNDAMTTTGTNDAANQLAALLANLAGQAMNADQIGKVVDERITAALSKIPTVKFEVKGFDGKTRETNGHKHPKFGQLLAAATSRQINGFAPNIWISGPTGSGKTHACQMLAEALGLDFHCHGATEMTHELLGFIDAAGTYHRTPFRDAFEHGGVAILDECDAWGSAALLALNSMTSNGIGMFPDGKVTRHQNCIIIATANTWGLGATADYVGRSKIDAAFLSRFSIRIDWQYDVALEIALSGNQNWAERVIEARNRAKAAGLKVVICPRVTLSGAALIANGVKPDDAAKMTYLANVTPDQAKMIEGA